MIEGKEDFEVLQGYFMLKKYFRYLRNRAVLSYERAILSCFEPTDSAVSILDCGCDDGSWTLKLSADFGNARLLFLRKV